MSFKKTYIYGNSQILAQYDSDWRDVNTDKYFYLHDRLGSVRQVMDSTASVKNCYTYDRWGLPVGDETGETFFNPYRFAGYFWDDEVSQYHCFRRQYNPVLGRFTSRDPVTGKFKEPLTLHKYLYCQNDPLNRTDPTGEISYTGLFTSMTIGAIQGAFEWYKGGSPYDIFSGAVAGGVGALTGGWLGGAGLMAKIMTGALASVATVGTEHLLEWDPERLFADIFGAGIVGGALGGAGGLLAESFAAIDIGRQWIPLPARSFLETLSQKEELYAELIGVTGSTVWDALLETYKAFK